MPDDIIAFLRTHGAPYCFRCLAFAFPLARVRHEIEAVRAHGAPVLIGDGRCVMCAQTTTVVAWVTGDPDLARLGG